MASPIFSTFEPWPQDTGYVVQVDHFDGNDEQRTLIPVAGAPTAAANYAALITKTRAALGNNQTFLALASPSQAQTLAQVQALTRQVDGIIYFLLHALTGLSSTPGT